MFADVGIFRVLIRRLVVKRIGISRHELINAADISPAVNMLMAVENRRYFVTFKNFPERVAVFFLRVQPFADFGTNRISRFMKKNEYIFFFVGREIPFQPSPLSFIYYVFFRFFAVEKNEMRIFIIK